MFWSAVLDLKTPRPSTRSYGSFGRPSSTSFHIPQSIPEHQPVSQFTSPLPDRFRIEEYLERPDTAFARARASLQLSKHTQTALKLLLLSERESTPTQASVQPTDARDMPRRSKIRGNREVPERTPLLKPSARAHGQEEPNPQESSNEHNYWMQELERRRAGLRKSRRRTCTPLSERATTSPLKVGVVMCSVPLVLVLGFLLFVYLSSSGTGVSTDTIASGNAWSSNRQDDLARQERRKARTVTRSLEEAQVEEEIGVMALAQATRLRGVEALT